MRRMTPVEYYVMYGGDVVERELARDRARKLASMTPEEIEADRIKTAKDIKQIEAYLTLTILPIMLYLVISGIFT